MKSQAIRRHWQSLASRYRFNLKATTKTPTIKALEIDALCRAMRRAGVGGGHATILEVGCGNGHNLIELARHFPKARFTGVDYSPLMIENARKHTHVSRVRFHVADALSLSSCEDLSARYDIVFTDRCLINLNKSRLQAQALRQLVGKIRRGGHLILIENTIQNYARQNECRRAVGLPSRKSAAYNLFIDEKKLLKSWIGRLRLILTEDFGSLHDLVLYVLVPMLNGGDVDYKHRWVSAATDLSLSIARRYPGAFGAFGQNRLYLFKKK